MSAKFHFDENANVLMAESIQSKQLFYYQEENLIRVVLAQQRKVWMQPGCPEWHTTLF